MKKFLLTSSIVWFMGCSRNEMKHADTFCHGKPLAELTKKNLIEASGLAASFINPGYLWTHNDSGNSAAVFLIDQKATVRLVCKLKGIKNRDWEDVSVGPGPDRNKSYIYVADIGDNNAIYPLKYIYRFEEPLLKEHEEEIEITQIDKISFQLPDKQKDTECLLLDPATKDLYVISKRENPVYIYQLRYPYSITNTLTATKLFSIPATQIVAGCISFDGTEILLKNYDYIYYWKKIRKDEKLIDVLKEKPKTLPYTSEPQGEAIAWARDGSGFFTVSENVIGKKSYLSFYKRK